MRIIYFGNNLAGLRVLEWLLAQGDEITALVLHPAEKSRYRDEIIAAARLPADRIFDGPQLRHPTAIEALRALRPEIGLSVFFGYILRQDVLALFPAGCLNLHSSYLPHNRGAYANVWSIVGRTPAGATLHYVDEGVDTGDIVAQKQVPVLSTDTGKALYARLEEACIELFKEVWPLVRSGNASRVPQDHSKATHHRVADVERIDRIDLDRTYTARELLDIIRARTFPPFKGAYFEEAGERVYMRLELLRDAEVRRPDHQEGDADAR